MQAIYISQERMVVEFEQVILTLEHFSVYVSPYSIIQIKSKNYELLLGWVSLHVRMAQVKPIWESDFIAVNFHQVFQFRLICPIELKLCVHSTGLLLIILECGDPIWSSLHAIAISVFRFCPEISLSLRLVISFAKRCLIMIVVVHL